MLKSLTRLWLSGMQQAATVQRSQQKRLLKSLLPKPPKKARSTVKAAPKPRARPTAPSVPAAPVAPFEVVPQADSGFDAPSIERLLRSLPERQ